MLWWVKARQAHTLLPLTTALAAVLLVVLQDTVTLLPSLSVSGGVEVVAVLFVPVPVVAALLACLESRPAAAEVSGVRAVGLLDLGLVVTVVAVICAVGLAAGEFFHSDPVTAAGRNTAFLVGLMLCARSVAGRVAVLAPVAWIFAVIIAGFRPNRDPYPWTVVAEPAGAPHAAAGAAALLAVGLVAHLRTARSLP